ncbi:MAG: hypothetical protein HQL32_13785 [Planctomycetes bacterium]|nr:hypothetical protein [Planctomycetota bacterium]
MTHSCPAEIKGVILDDEPLDLAPQLIDHPASLLFSVISEEPYEEGSIVYGACPLSIGELAEVKAMVQSCTPVEGGNLLTLDVQALDKRFEKLSISTLKGETPVAEDDSPSHPIGLKQTDGTYAILINCPAGILSAKQIERIAELSHNGAGFVKLSHGQRLLLMIKAEQLDTIESDLHKIDLSIGVLHHGIRNVRGCCGSLCKWAQKLDGKGLAQQINDAFKDRKMLFDTKIAVSDCTRNCMECFCVDIGVLGDGEYYDVYVGGSASSYHIKALPLRKGLAMDEVIPVISEIFEWQDIHTTPGERIYKTLERIGATQNDGASELFLKVDELFNKVIDLDTATSQSLQMKLTRLYGLKKMKEDMENMQKKREGQS